MEMETVEFYLRKAGEMIIEYTPKVLGAIIILFIGVRIINKLTKMTVEGLKRRGLGSDLAPFLASLLGIALKVLLVFTVASVLGVDVASFIAVLAAAGFAIGLALQGSLSNFAAGIIIVLFRPYKIGDWVQIPDEYFGQVADIQIFNTILTTPGKKTLIVPNGEVISGVVTNYSVEGHIRLELQILMAYEESFPRLRAIILDCLRNLDVILNDPEPEVGIEAYDTHNVVVGIRPFVKPDDYWEATFAVNERVKRAMSEHGIKMAYSEGVELGVIGE